MTRYAFIQEKELVGVGAGNILPDGLQPNQARGGVLSLQMGGLQPNQARGGVLSLQMGGLQQMFQKMGGVGVLSGGLMVHMVQVFMVILLITKVIGGGEGLDTSFGLLLQRGLT
jgi:hypothetical protein